MGDLSLISRLTQEIQSLKLNVLLAFYFCCEIGLRLVKLKVYDLLKFVRQISPCWAPKKMDNPYFKSQA